jgi:hypothetical protein
MGNFIIFGTLWVAEIVAMDEPFFFFLGAEPSAK